MSERQTPWTPGPWETDRSAVRSEGPTGRQICLCEISVRGRPYDETYDEAIANARLIAAAPDLYEVLTDIAKHFEGDAGLERAMKIGMDAEVIAARAALSKARQP